MISVTIFQDLLDKADEKLNVTLYYFNWLYVKIKEILLYYANHPEMYASVAWNIIKCCVGTVGVYAIWMLVTYLYKEILDFVEKSIPQKYKNSQSRYSFYRWYPKYIECYLHIVSYCSCMLCSMGQGYNFMLRDISDGNYFVFIYGLVLFITTITTFNLYIKHSYLVLADTKAPWQRESFDNIAKAYGLN